MIDSPINYTRGGIKTCIMFGKDRNKYDDTTDFTLVFIIFPAELYKYFRESPSGVIPGTNKGYFRDGRQRNKSFRL